MSRGFIAFPSPFGRQGSSLLPSVMVCLSEVQLAGYPKGRRLGRSVMLQDVSKNTRYGLYISSLIESQSVLIHKLFKYLVEWFSSIVHYTLLVPLHHITKAGSGAYVPNSFVAILDVVFLFIIFVGLSV